MDQRAGTPGKGGGDGMSATKVKESPDDLICEDCGKVVTVEEMKPIEEVDDLLSRVDPGELMPEGECPCGALVHKRNAGEK